MRAQIGDRLVIADDDDRVGIVIGLPHADGSPPYVIRWLNDGHVALVSPGPYARLVPADRHPKDTPPPDAGQRRPAGTPADGRAPAGGQAAEVA